MVVWESEYACKLTSYRGGRRTKLFRLLRTDDGQHPFPYSRGAGGVSRSVNNCFVLTISHLYTYLSFNGLMFMLFIALSEGSKQVVKDTRSMVQFRSFPISLFVYRVFQAFCTHVKTRVVIALLHVLCAGQFPRSTFVRLFSNPHAFIHRGLPSFHIRDPS